ncbi:MAG: T9SS type A sorting domain-containing protein, partial [Bacteroidetes bacterium]|nr:T9SS type A sorting domain-containing protein [Bacteroidota bacterium]
SVNQLLYKASIYTGNLEDGCYFVTIKGNNINETKKIIIQK